MSIQSLTLPSVELTFESVSMEGGFPSTVPARWLAFLVGGGKFMSISREDADRAQSFMRLKNSEAIRERESGLTYTVAGCRLVECDPNYASRLEEKAG